MSIRYNEANRSFQLDTRAASYVIGIADADTQIALFSDDAPRKK